jgi:hypothetical protein
VKPVYGVTDVRFGYCHRTEADGVEVEQLRLGRRTSRRRTLLSRLRSSQSIRRGLHRVSRWQAWVQTLLLEIRSLYFRIRDMHERDLVLRYETGPVCVSCQKSGIVHRCTAVRAYIRDMQQLSKRRPWLSYSDSTLVREGWCLAYQSIRNIPDCHIECESDSDQSLKPLSAADFIPHLTVQQSSKRDLTIPLPSQE